MCDNGKKIPQQIGGLLGPLAMSRKKTFILKTRTLFLISSLKAHPVD
jgi:hypothetical protein